MESLNTFVANNDCKPLNIWDLELEENNIKQL